MSYLIPLIPLVFFYAIQIWHGVGMYIKIKSYNREWYDGRCWRSSGDTDYRFILNSFVPFILLYRFGNTTPRTRSLFYSAFKGPFVDTPKRDRARRLKRVRKNSNQPSMILANLLAADILQNLKAPDTFQGKNFVISYGSGSARLGSIDFTPDEFLVINEAIETAAKLAKQKSIVDKEAERQIMCLDLISDNLNIKSTEG